MDFLTIGPVPKIFYVENIFLIPICDIKLRRQKPIEHWILMVASSKERHRRSQICLSKPFLNRLKISKNL